MNHPQIIAQIIRERVTATVVRHFIQAGVVPEGRELIPGDDYFRNNVDVRATQGMEQHVDVLDSSGRTPRYHAHGTIRAQFYGGARAYSTSLSYSFIISLGDVMRVIAREVEVEWERGEDEDEQC